jgi:hypothetical protein
MTSHNNQANTVVRKTRERERESENKQDIKNLEISHLKRKQRKGNKLDE